MVPPKYQWQSSWRVQSPPSTAHRNPRAATFFRCLTSSHPGTCILYTPVAIQNFPLMRAHFGTQSCICLINQLTLLRQSPMVQHGRHHSPSLATILSHLLPLSPIVLLHSRLLLNQTSGRFLRPSVTVNLYKSYLVHRQLTKN